MRAGQGVIAAAVALALAGCGGEPPPAVAYDLILDAQGVVFAGDDASYARFPFGSPRTEIERAAGVLYGDATALRSVSRACEAGPMAFTSYGAIQLAFRDDALVGWTMRRGAAAAADGSIAPGISRAQLERLTAIHMVPDRSRSGEFAYRTPAGAIHGVLAGSGPEARVEALFAGTVCTPDQSVNSNEKT